MTKNEKKWVVELIPKKKCRYCLSTEWLTYDHKVPIIQGGKTQRGNIQVLCAWCNGVKSGLSDKRVKILARWIFLINEQRAKANKRPLGFHKLSTTTH